MMNSILFMASTVTASSLSPQARVESTLNQFHKAASEAKFEAYFGFFAEDGVCIGTDASERWTVKQFKEYARPHFAKGKAWTYTSRSRNISFNKDESVAWFDEILDSASYGTSRGTGVLILENAKWKIAQYHLTFPIPNDLAGKLTAEIKTFEQTKK